MKLQYEITSKDYITAIKNEFKKNKTSSAIILVIFPILFIFPSVVLISLGEEADMSILGVLVFILFIIALILIIKNKSIMAAIIYRRQLKSGEIDRQYIGKHTLELGENSIKMNYGNISGERIYSGIRNIHDGNNMIMIYVSSSAFDIIPNSAFVNKEQKHAFINFLESKINTSKNVELNLDEIKEETTDAAYTLEYAWTQDNFIDSMTAGGRMLYKTKLVWTSGWIIRILLSLFLIYKGIIGIYEAIIYNVENNPIPNNPAPIFWLIFAGILQMDFIMIFTPLGKKTLYNHINNGQIPRDSIGKQILCVSNEKLALYKRASSGETNMEQVYCIKRDNKCLYIILKGKRFLAIPLSAFQSEAQIQEFTEYINERIKK